MKGINKEIGPKNVDPSNQIDPNPIFILNHLPLIIFNSNLSINNFNHELDSATFLVIFVVYGKFIYMEKVLWTKLYLTIV